MNPRVKEAILWGVVGMLTFLVLLQGYELLEDIRVDLTVKVGATFVVGLVTTVVTYLASGRMIASGNGNRPVDEKSVDAHDDNVDDDNKDHTNEGGPDEDHTNEGRTDGDRTDDDHVDDHDD